MLSDRGVAIIRSRVVERAAYVLGAMLLLTWAGATARGRLAAAEALEAFSQAPVDTSAWSPERVKAYVSARSSPATPLAILTIPRLGLTVPVLEGVDAAALDRGAGHIPETASPGQPGNVGIAGHRDGFFRGLKDVRVGDEIRLETHRELAVYVVEKTWVVEPEDLSVLEPTSGASITLVTCFPFYYVGAAPRRFIVRASVPLDRPIETR